MKVLLINGSPHEKGCTYTALSLIAKELNDAGVDTEILHVGGKPVGGCIGCGGCFYTCPEPGALTVIQHTTDPESEA